MDTFSKPGKTINKDYIKNGRPYGRARGGFAAYSSSTSSDAYQKRLDMLADGFSDNDSDTPLHRRRPPRRKAKPPSKFHHSGLLDATNGDDMLPHPEDPTPQTTTTTTTTTTATATTAAATGNGWNDEFIDMGERDRGSDTQPRTRPTRQAADRARETIDHITAVSTGSLLAVEGGFVEITATESEGAGGGVALPPGVLRVPSSQGTDRHMHRPWEGTADDIESSCDEGTGHHDHFGDDLFDGIQNGHHHHHNNGHDHRHASPRDALPSEEPGGDGEEPPDMWRAPADARTSLFEMERIERAAEKRQTTDANGDEEGDGNGRGGGGGGGGPAFSDAMRSRRPTPRVECFGCTYGNNIYDGELSRNMAGLYAIFADCYINTDLWVLCRQMHAYFMNRIYEPAQELKRLKPLEYDIPKWTTQQIYDHFMHHLYDPRIHCLKSIKMLDELQETLQPFCTMVDEETGRSKPDHRNIKSLLDVMKLNNSMREERNFKGMFGYDANLPIDMGRVSQVLVRNKVRYTRTE